MAHRAEAQKLSGITAAQAAGLSLGRAKGTNHRAGYTHKDASKQKCSASHRAFHAANPEAAKARGAKTRGPFHYLWKGGVSRLNQSIRRMTENLAWADAVKSRDGCCVSCGSTVGLEANHIVALATLLDRHGVKNRDDARRCASLWDVTNGSTLCEPCHYRLHGRTMAGEAAKAQVVFCTCKTCGKRIRVKPSRIAAGGGKYCSRGCASAGRRSNIQTDA